ncbi:MAG: hypothetical protein WBH04_00930 [Albidovulum sp.]
MRSVTHADVMAAARRLWGLPREAWEGALSRALIKAHAADRYRKRIGRCHPLWGNGSLAGALMSEGPLPPQPFLSDTTFLEATAEAINSIVEWRKRQKLNC